MTPILTSRRFARNCRKASQGPIDIQRFRLIDKPSRPPRRTPAIRIL